MPILTEISYTQLENRFDSEYYRPEYLEIRHELDHIKNKNTMKDLFIIKDGDHAERSREFVKVGKRYLRAQDLKDGFIDDKEAVFVSDKIFAILKRSYIYPLNILFSIMGATDKISIYPEGHPIVTANRAIAILRVKDTIKLNPYFAFIFLKSKFGFNQIIRNKKGGVQQRINLADFENILIPLPPRPFQLKIEKLVKEAFSKRVLAEKKYEQAKQLLEKELVLDNLKLKEKKTFEVKYSELFESGRFDSEYYKPKYKKIIEFLKNSGFEVKKLKNVVKISNLKIDPTKEPTKKFRYVPIAKINQNGEIGDWEEFNGWQAPSRAKMLIKKGDVLVSSLGGSLNKIALVPEELNNSIATTGTFVINSENFYSEFLFLLFRTELIKLQLEQKTAGAIMTAVPKTTFGDLLIPSITKQKQENIAELIKQSFALRKESKQLLNEAKEKVEKMILN